MRPNADSLTTDNGISFAHAKNSVTRIPRPHAKEPRRLFMTKFYLRPVIVFLSAYLFFAVRSAGAQENYRLQQNLEQLQQQQQIDQPQRGQEINQLQQQLNEIPRQPAEGMQRQQRLNELQQNQFRQQQQLDQLREQE